jgi:ketosteroid isomerase-like protein
MPRNISDLIRQYFSAYETKDRNVAEALLSDDFTFSSPRDDRIGRAEYFARCWPNSGKFRAFHIERLFDQGNEAFVRYLCEPKSGDKFRNTEYFRADGDKIVEVDVYFGRSLPVNAVTNAAVEK